MATTATTTATTAASASTAPQHQITRLPEHPEPILPGIRMIWATIAPLHEILANRVIQGEIFSFLAHNHLVVDREDLVFCPPPAGKPDPNIAPDPKGLKPRPRIAQAPQKGNTCWYYAACMIWQRIGKHPLSSQLEQREVEKMISQQRKEFAQVDIDFDTEFGLSRAVVESWGKEGSFTIGHARNILDKATSEQTTWRYWPQCSAILREFCSQTEHADLLNYVGAKKEKRFPDKHKKLLEINEKVLAYLKGSAKEFYEREMMFVISKSWNKLSLYETSLVTFNATKEAGWQAQGLRRSRWHPSQSINVLRHNLRLYGPHLIGAKIGKQFYVDPPFKLVAQIAGTDVYGWTPNAKRVDPSQTADINHMVVVVGADLDRVYYVDPLDGSDPKFGPYAKIYVTSYRRLQEMIGNLSGMRCAVSKTKGPQFAQPWVEGENNYAMHGNPEIAYL
jgi:hypothetical protein